MTKTLTTQRFTLRPYRMSDAPVVAGYLNDIDFGRWIGMMPYPYTLADAQEFIGSELENGPSALVVLEGDTLKGCVSNRAELGYWVAKPFWGQGIATEASRAVIADHFRDPNQPEIHSGHAVDNHASARVLSKLGFRPNGFEDRPNLALGRPNRLQKRVLTRADWEARS